MGLFKPIVAIPTISLSFFCSCHSVLLSTVKSSNMDLVLGDFCLSCDCQTNGTAFCSSACRLKQLDHFTLAEATTPIVSGGGTTTPIVAQPLSLSVSTTGFYLPPAYDFSIHRAFSSNVLQISISSWPHSPKMAEQARNDLKTYTGAFDQTRTIRRRASTQSNDDVKTCPKA
jgi:hypothetical protein